MTSTGGLGRTAGAEAGARTELISPEPAEALAGLMDIDPPKDGELPPLWHWIYLVERRPQRDLGSDGHPVSGIPVPPGAGRLRMFGGGRVTTQRALQVGVPATKTTRVLREVEKAGASGPMTVTTIGTQIAQNGQVAISEEQDILYRSARFTVAPDPTATTDVARAVPAGRLEMVVDAVVLFRFSALTYNAHRIHYDIEYAKREGYPGLVVHGPLQALLMGECFRRSGATLVGSTFAYRLVAPTFGDQRITVTTHLADGHRSARVQNGQDRTTATATLRPRDPAPE